MLSQKSGALALNLITGNQSVTGLGFQPKLVMFMSNPDTSNILLAVANMHWSFGAFDGTNQIVEACNSRNGVTPSQTVRYADSTHVISVADPPGNPAWPVDYSASAVSLDADGFTINIDNAPPINYRFGYLALGGNDIANVKVGRFQSPGTTGPQAITGLGFQPTLIILLTSATFGGVPYSGGDASVGIGWGKGALATDQYALGVYHQTGVPTPTNNSVRTHNTGYVVFLPTSTTFIGYKALLSTLDADGFTLNWTVHSPIVSMNMSYIAIQGSVDLKVATGTKSMTNNATGGTNPVTGLPFNPTVGLFAGNGLQPLNLLNGTGMWSMGWADSALRHFVDAGTGRHQAGTMHSYHSTHDARCIRQLDYSSSPLLEDYSVQSWDTGGFTIYNNKGAFPNTGETMGYLVMEGVGGPPPVVSAGDFGFML